MNLASQPISRSPRNRLRQPLLPLVGLALTGLLLLAAALSSLAIAPWPSASAQRVAPPPAAQPVPTIVSAPASGVSGGPGHLLPRVELPHDTALNAKLRTDTPGPFPFQTVTSSDGMIALHYYYRSQSDGAALVSEISSIVQNTVQARLGLTLQRRVDLYAYNSRADFLTGALPDSPDITAAYTTYDGSATYLPIDANTDWVSILSHELTHVVLHQNFPPGQLTYALYPHWLDEGMAESDVPAGGLYATYDDAILNGARSSGRLVNIFDIFRWDYPQNPATDDLCYAESRAFILYAVATYGQTSFHGFVHDLLSGNVDYAADANFGIDAQTLQTNWMRSVGMATAAHAPATLPTPQAAQPFSGRTLGGVAATRTPFPVPGGDVFFFDALVKLGITLGVLLVLLALAELAVRILWPRLKPRIQSLRASRTPADRPLSLPAGRSMEGEGAGNGAVADTMPASRTVVATAVAGEATEPQSSHATPSSAAWLVAPGRVWELAALALLLPVAFGVGVLWTRIDPAQLWRHAYLAAILALFLGMLGMVALFALALRQRRIVPVFVIALVVVLLSALTTFGDGRAAGLAQGHAYGDAEAYALSYGALDDAGAPRTDLHDIQRRWAETADVYDDLAAATLHYQDAVAVAPSTTDAQRDRGDLMLVTDDWGTRLTRAHEFAQALTVYSNELQAPSCDTACHSALDEESGATELAWATFLTESQQLDAASAQLQRLVAHFPTTKAAASAKLALAGADKGIAAAVGAERGGDIAAMNLILERTAVEHPTAPDGALASGFSEPVTDTISQFELYGPTTHVFLFAFGDTASAQAFIADRETDTSLFKVGAVADQAGAFSALVPPGYYYVPVWEAASQDGYPGWHYTASDAFMVAPFTPLTVQATIQS